MWEVDLIVVMFLSLMVSRDLPLGHDSIDPQYSRGASSMRLRLHAGLLWCMTMSLVGGLSFLVYLWTSRWFGFLMEHIMELPRKFTTKRTRKRKRKRRKSTTTQCSVCKKFGHVAANCWYKDTTYTTAAIGSGTTGQTQHYRLDHPTVPTLLRSTTINGSTLTLCENYLRTTSSIGD